MQMGKETSEREPTRAGENSPTPTSARSACEISRVSFCKKGANFFLPCYFGSIVPLFPCSAWVFCERVLFGVQSASHLALNPPSTPITCPPAIILMAQQHFSHLGPDYCSSLCSEPWRFIKSLGFNLRISPARTMPSPLCRAFTWRLATASVQAELFVLSLFVLVNESWWKTLWIAARRENVSTLKAFISWAKLCLLHLAELLTNQNHWWQVLDWCHSLH